MIVLDTDVLIEIMDRKSKRGDEALEKVIYAGESIAITVINLHEIMYGLFRQGKQVKELEELKILDFTGNDVRLSAKIEATLKNFGEDVGRFDAMIAAIVINNEAKLFTFNTCKTSAME